MISASTKRLLKLSAIGLALLLVPRRSSEQALPQRSMRENLPLDPINNPPTNQTTSEQPDV